MTMIGDNDRIAASVRLCPKLNVHIRRISIVGVLHKLHDRSITVLNQIPADG